MLKSQVGQNTSLLSLSTHFKTVSFSSVVKQLYMTKSYYGAIFLYWVKFGLFWNICQTKAITWLWNITLKNLENQKSKSLLLIIKIINKFLSFLMSMWKGNPDSPIFHASQIDHGIMSNICWKIQVKWFRSQVFFLSTHLNFSNLLPPGERCLYKNLCQIKAHQNIISWLACLI